MFNYESSLVNFRNPYQLKAGQRIGTSTKMPKKREEYKNPVIAAYERPQSANVAQRKKMKITVPQAFGMLPEREEMIITGFSSKKRYPSSSQKDDSYKWK